MAGTTQLRAQTKARRVISVTEYCFGGQISLSLSQDDLSSGEIKTTDGKISWCRPEMKPQVLEHAEWEINVSPSQDKEGYEEAQGTKYLDSPLGLMLRT